MRGYAIPIVLGLVAIAQLWRVDDEGLTRWKGGGFGMYSDFHVKQREVWVQAGAEALAAGPGVPQTLEIAAGRCARFASPSCLRELRDPVLEVFPQARHLQVWTFDVDPQTSSMGRRLVTHWTLNGGRDD